MSDPIARLNTALEGRYEIDRELGEGGMATVYLAKDLKHNRNVALKVLKPELAAVVGAERFLAEIKTTANLTHPHILPLFDSGEADGFLFYVMPHIEGESLRERIDREKQLGVDDAVAITQKVANALDYAHGHGIVHRDIKPGNILLSEQGEPLIADFGIALAVAQAGAGRITKTGLSLGTPHYMSPEQATGDRDVDPRSDVYALGCVLYEMLAGQPPFSATTAQAVLVKILTADAPSITSERRTVPPHVGHALAKSLEKLPADRFTSAAEFAAALGDESFTYKARARTSVVASTPEPGSTPATMPGPWKRLTVTFAALAALTTFGFGWLLLRPEGPRPVTRISVRMPDDQNFHSTRGDFDLSADGSLLVYRGVGDAGQPQLWARRWDALDATPIRDTDEATRPAISPDGQEVVFVRGGVIRVVPLQGGVSRTLPGGGATRWSPDGAWIYYRDASQGLSRVPSGGGTAEIVTVLDTAGGDSSHNYPDVLPGGRVVYQVNGRGVPRIQAMVVGTDEVEDLTAGRYPRYSETGHLLFQDANEGILLAAPFDVERLELTGAALPVAEALLPVGRGAGNFAVSRTGRLVYRERGSAGLPFTPVWVERDGTAREIQPGWRVGANTGNSSLRLSGDGTRLAMAIADEDGVFDLQVKQLDTGPLSRVTFEATNRRAVWSPDGESLTFVSTRAGQNDLWTKRADATGTATLVLDTEFDLLEVLHSPDGQWLVYREETGTDVDDDIYAIRVGADGVEGDAFAVAETEFSERAPAISPDGRWLAYQSSQSGRGEEVYVRPFPPVAGSVLLQVSANGGFSPVWAHDGRELFYRNGLNELVAVQVSGDATFTAGEEEVLFAAADYMAGQGHAMYDVSPDDQRFVMLRIGDLESGSGLILVENWAEELDGRVGN